MFTGIVQSLGTVRALERQGAGARLQLALPAAMLRRLKAGDSVAVNGCCLTLVSKRGGVMAADLTRETLERTNLGSLAPGVRVNLELPLRLGDMLGGHLLQGHVEGTGVFNSLERLDGTAAGWRLRLTVPPALTPYLVPKGSIAVEGISLTIAALRGRAVEVAIVPHTYRRTNLRWLSPGDPVNLETDPLARHVARLVEHLLARPKRKRG